MCPNKSRNQKSAKHPHELKNQYWSLCVLTWSPQEEKHSYPVDPEEHEAKEGPDRLQDQQGKVDEHFTCHMEQGDGESHPLPHEEHHNQENYLEG